MTSADEKTNSPNLDSISEEPDLIGVLDEAIAILGCEGKGVADFYGALAWFEQRRDIWKRHEWRVALIGITSSGKSTLINALLGQTLLPTGVAPTSSINIFCRRSKSISLLCRIRYKDKREPAEFRGNKTIRQALARMADERGNPGNKLGIDEIDFFSPKLPFAGEIVVVDTPGLDAHGLPEHEKLTLVSLLPSVDMAVFLQPPKANSSDVIYGFLKEIKKEDKPLIYLITQSDAVARELGRGGATRKTKIEVLNEHLDIARKWLLHAGFDQASVPVLPVSAKFHLEGKTASSGVRHFAECVEQRVQEITPQLWDKRCRQLRKELSKICEINFSYAEVTGAQKNIKKRRQQLTEAQDLLDEITKRLMDKTTSIAEVAASHLETLRSQANNLREGSADCGAAQNICGSFENVIKKAGVSLGEEVITESNHIRNVGESLNLTVEDMVFGEGQMKPIPRIGVRISTKEVDDEGFVAGFLRLFNMGGRHREEFLDSEDLIEFKRKCEMHCDAYVEWIKNEATKVILANLEKGAQPVIDEIKRQQEELELQENSQLSREVRLRVASAFKRLVERLPETGDKTDPATHAHPFPETKDLYNDIEVSPLVESLLSLSSNVSRQRMLMLRDKAITLATKRAGFDASRRAVVVGYDTHSFDRFISLYWHDFPEHNLDTEHASQDEKQATISCAYDIIEKRRLLSTRCNPLETGIFEKPCTLFLIIDPASVSQILRSDILQVLRLDVGLVLVVQSIAGLSNESIPETILCLHKFRLGHQMSIDAVLVNNEEAFFTTVFDAVFNKLQKGDAFRDETALRAALYPEGDRQEHFLNKAIEALRFENAKKEHV